jgi:hypothetical protein
VLVPPIQEVWASNVELPTIARRLTTANTAAQPCADARKHFLKRDMCLF